MALNDLICKAITNSSQIRFIYHGAVRWVEPHTYGTKKTGREAICAWQRSGGSGEGFRYFFLDEISSFELGDSFQGARHGYRRDDPQFAMIFAQL